MRQFGLYLSVILILTSCTKSDFRQAAEWVGGQDIFSDRPQNKTHAIALVKLKSPALLTSVHNTSGKKQIDQNLKKQVDQEHAQAVADLQKISGEIRIIYQYKMVLNAIAVVTPVQFLEKIGSLGGVAYTEREGQFHRPKVFSSAKNNRVDRLAERNSVNFLRADLVHKMNQKNSKGDTVPLDGSGMQVGIIDTGIDYTHAMFGGAGTEEAFKAIEPSGRADGFPNAKVVGGIDLVGTAFDSGSQDFKHRIPVPDLNPIDEGGHGTHVAGTVAGIGDGENTYSGVAPGARLHAIKVFGADGSTSDTVVVAGLEYAADPNQDGDISDQLDVVNLSLGSDYGSAHILYAEAVETLSNGGTIVVAAAGNAGPEDYIVGAPSVVDHAISVAASVDHTDHNWKFSAVKFMNSAGGSHLAEAIEGSITIPISQAGAVQGQLVEVGLAKEDLSPDLAAQLKGHVALVDRGQATFSDKIKRVVQAGAIGIVLVNNQPGAAFKMGGDGSYPIPGIMITQALGDQLKQEMKSGSVTLHFQTPELVEKPELIDTITDFSSKGPRSFDGFIKPEIAAPGENIISAAMGGGRKGEQMSGTSMATPHMAGVMALIKQAHPQLSSAELKSLAMNQSVRIQDADKENYPVTYQGAGRVDALNSVSAQIIASPAALSIGEMNVARQKTVQFSVLLKNISTEKLEGILKLANAAEELTLVSPAQVEIAPGQMKKVLVKLRIDISNTEEAVQEIDGHLQVMQGAKALISLPILAIVKKNSALQGGELKVGASSSDSVGASVELAVTNSSDNAGKALPFNLLGRDQRKPRDEKSKFKSRECDLEMAGYKIIEREENGLKKQIVQFGFKLFQPTTTWMSCEVSVLIDRDGDDQPDQELAGAIVGGIAGLDELKYKDTFASLLLDSNKARQLRRQYEIDREEKKDEASLSYKSALIGIQPMKIFNHSTVAVIEVDSSLLVKNDHNEVKIKLASIHNESSPVEMDDYLGNGLKQWMTLSLDPENQGYHLLPDALDVGGQSKEVLSIEKGYGNHSLMVLYPDNAYSFSNSKKDSQSQIFKAKFMGSSSQDK